MFGFLSKSLKNRVIWVSRVRFIPFFLLLVASIITNLLLARKVRVQEQMLIAMSAKANLIGLTVPPIDVRTADGQVQRITHSGDRATVLYIFRPECGWCEKNVANINALAAQINQKYRILGVSLPSERAREYVDQGILQFPTYSEVEETTQLAYKLGPTPQTLVISSEGRVLKNWKGAYSSTLKQEIEEYFNLHLPGINVSGSTSTTCNEPTDNNQ
jgi:peroxiredoxin